MKMGILKKIGFLAGSLVMAVSAYAQGAEVLSVDLHGSKYMTMPGAIVRMAVGDSTVAKVTEVPGSSHDFMIFGRGTGSTSLFVWTASGARYEYIIGVSSVDPGQAKVIEDAIGLPGVKVKMVGERILLSGTVENQYERNYAVRTAQLFMIKEQKTGNYSVGSDVDMSVDTANTSNSGGNTVLKTSQGVAVGQVIDLLHMLYPSQIRMEAQVISINPENIKNLGIVYGRASGDDLISSPGIFYVGDSYGSGDKETTFAHNPWKWMTDRWGGINMALRALVSDNKAKILSRPSITTMSGEEAIIQVGGEIPYTQRDSNGSPHTEWKNYGIILQFKPVVDAQGRIVASIHTEVSMPSGESVDGQPILDRRRADSVVTVDSGSTMVIGGLMDSRDYKTVRKFPFLGDIPVLGEFFKYTSHNKDNQEMIILVTPTLVEEGETSKAAMTREMKDYYTKGRRAAEAREQVDLDEPLPEEEGEKKSSAGKAQEKSEQSPKEKIENKVRARAESTEDVAARAAKNK
ncbi:MAG: pilus assembly protein N-terminal domain-containing protein [Selenomonas sp.]|nr:pilus assembly protein N-terminal domain-containing protein [Selenomonas sp.]